VGRTWLCIPVVSAAPIRDQHPALGYAGRPRPALAVISRLTELSSDFELGQCGYGGGTGPVYDAPNCHFCRSAAAGRCHARQRSPCPGTAVGRVHPPSTISICSAVPATTTAAAPVPPVTGNRAGSHHR
jgi:hypothetical protein